MLSMTADRCRHLYITVYGRSFPCHLRQRLAVFSCILFMRLAGPGQAHIPHSSAQALATRASRTRSLVTGYGANILIINVLLSKGVTLQSSNDQGHPLRMVQGAGVGLLTAMLCDFRC